MTEEWFFECLRIDKEPSSILVRLLVSSYDIDYFNNVCLYLALVGLEGCSFKVKEDHYQLKRSLSLFKKGGGKNSSTSQLSYKGALYECWEEGERWELTIEIDLNIGINLSFYEGDKLVLTSSLFEEYITSVKGHQPVGLPLIKSYSSYPHIKHYWREEEVDVSVILQCYEIRKVVWLSADRQEVEIRMSRRYLAYCYQILLLIQELEIERCWWRSEVIKEGIKAYTTVLVLNNKGEIYLKFRLRSGLAMKTLPFNILSLIDNQQSTNLLRDYRYE